MLSLHCNWSKLPGYRDIQITQYTKREVWKQDFFLKGFSHYLAGVQDYLDLSLGCFENLQKLTSGFKEVKRQFSFIMV